MAAPKARITADGIEVWRDGEWQLADVAPQSLPAEADEWWDQPDFWQGESPY